MHEGRFTVWDACGYGGDRYRGLSEKALTRVTLTINIGVLCKIGFQRLGGIGDLAISTSATVAGAETMK
jgi:hypothetical protein